MSNRMGNLNRPSERFSVVRKLTSQIERLSVEQVKHPAEATLANAEQLQEDAYRIMKERLEFAEGSSYQNEQDAQCCKMIVRMAEAISEMLSFRTEQIPEAQRL